MIELKSYVGGEWKRGRGEGRLLRHATTGKVVASACGEGLEFAAILDYGRDRGGALRQMTFHERAALLKQMAEVLNENRKEFYEIAATYGATPSDAKLDVDGGIATLGFYGSLGMKKLPASRVLMDGEVERLSKSGKFVGRHIYVSLQGAAVQINAYNFPAWGMLEKLAPSFLAGMPNVVKPATPTAWLAFRMVEVLIGSGTVPEGTLQLVCGPLVDFFDHLTSQDAVAFTGSESTGRKIRSHPAIVANSVRVNIEADSLNCIVLGPDVEPGTPAFDYFTKEVASEMTVKAGQKCTAIRRILVPQEKQDAVIESLKEKLRSIPVGDPAAEEVRMGPLVDNDAVSSAREAIETLSREAETVFGDPKREAFVGVEDNWGAFMEPILLHCPRPDEAKLVHEIEVFGPVATVLGYDDSDHAIRLARRGGGSLVGSIVSEDEEFSTRVALGLAPYHGRLMVMNAQAAPESTGHGVVMPHLIHGGPGRAGGGEELGGLRSVTHYMQRVALQGDPERLERICAASRVE